MALIQCPECGDKVSDTATACPHCGAPIARRADFASTGTQVQTVEETSKRLKAQILFSAILFWGGIFVFFAYADDFDANASYIRILSVVAFLFGFLIYISAKFSIWWHHK